MTGDRARSPAGRRDIADIADIGVYLGIDPGVDIGDAVGQASWPGQRGVRLVRSHGPVARDHPAGADLLQLLRPASHRCLPGLRANQAA